VVRFAASAPFLSVCATALRLSAQKPQPVAVSVPHQHQPGSPKGESVTRLTLKAVVLFALFGATLASAQTLPTFKHIVIIVQENRTPDNLFGSSPGQANCSKENPFEPGVDIVDGGPNKAAGGAITCLTPVANLNHGGNWHGHYWKKPNGVEVGWVPQCDADVNGICQMDGACHSDEYPNCPEYTYVTKNVVQPYFDIATNYGWANYMFQTNQGPSFPAHQFLFGGTSAPVWPGDGNNYFQDFVAENPKTYTSGCPFGSPFPNWVDPGGENEFGSKNQSQCYDHNTLVTYQDSYNNVWDKLAPLGLTWKYYAQTKGSIWDAPEANPQTCYTLTGPPSSPGTGCSGPEFNHVIFYDPKNKNNYHSAPILDDIADCTLPAISWVIPDERWSDHPDLHDNNQGPNWVAAIVDAIGTSWINSGTGHQCDYWGTNSPTPEPTAIFITWDDWGGFYDHVPPPATYKGRQNNQNQWICDTTKAPNGWGCGYVYGFRVPLLVVSEYTPAGTISGKISGPPSYPPPKEWTHDFGSILAFTENNFQLNPPFIAPQTPIKYTYADQNSLDATLPNGQQVVPLWDFFPGPARGFTNISPTNPLYDANYFMNYYQTTGDAPMGPDGGDDD
jgi:phospholipase C